MTEQEYKTKFNELFKDFKVETSWGEQDINPDDFWINDKLVIYSRVDQLVIGLWNSTIRKSVLFTKSSSVDELYDELIIFKELILPKYL